MNDRSGFGLEPEESLARQIVEFFACLTIAVILFQTFHAEAYVIPTGSMAPTLIGFHKQVTCPACRFDFALGISTNHLPSVASCPNCGQTDIDVEKLDQNDGDRLLVHKLAYAFQKPRRWDVVVFRNPNTPTEAYVKRFVGLPGETVEIRDGDIFIGGEIQRKSLATQRGIRIPVYDHDFRPPPNDPGWKPRWVADEAWSAREGGFSVDEPSHNIESQSSSVAWLTYRHWVRGGGSHSTSVPLARLPADLDLSEIGANSIRFDAREGVLLSAGVMPEELRDRLLSQSEERDFREAVNELFEESHVAPITDCYGYNRAPPGGVSGEETSVRDIMLSARFLYESGHGEFVVQISDGTKVFSAVFDFLQNQVRLEASGALAPLRTAALPPMLLERAGLVEFSVMDHSVLLAVDGKMMFEPWHYALDSNAKFAPRMPVRIGARGLRAQVDSLRLYRDVYYTPSPRGAGKASYSLRNDPEREEYFALGDNSPVSVDSRVWPADRPVTQDLILGKPFMVHLPSRTGKFRWGQWEGHLRIPDISRIRYIH